MTNTLSAEKSNAVLEAAKIARAHLKRALDLNPEDVAAISIEPVLDALGWDMRDPRVVRRSGSGLLTLLSRGTPALRMRALPAHEALPGALGESDLSDAKWIVLTNGIDWSIFNARNPGRAFRTFSIADHAGTREALDIISLLDHEVFKPDALDEAWMAEAMDSDVIRALMRHLDGSETLMTALESDLTSQGLAASRREIGAALSRIDIRMNGADDAQTPASAPAVTKSAVTKSAVTKPAAPARRGPGRPPKTETSPAAAKTSPAKSASAGGKKAGRPPKAKSGAARKVAEINNWPDQATHAMKRKQTTAFAHYDSKSGAMQLLPGSRLTKDVGKSIAQDLVERRETALSDGSMIEVDDMLEIVAPLSFDSYRAAASFAAGTEVSSPEAWITPDGKPLTNRKRARNTGAAKSAAKTDSVPAPEAQTA